MRRSTDREIVHGEHVSWAIVICMDRSGLGSHGAYLRCDLEAAFGRRAVRNAIVAGDLRQLWRGIVIDHERFLDPWTHAAAALLAAGPEGAISDVSAAVLQNCSWIKAPDTHITLPPGQKIATRPGLILHNRSFYSQDAIVVDGVRMFALDRVVADALCDGRPADALALADEVLRMAGDAQEVVRKQIAAAMERRQDPRGKVRGSALLSFATGRSASAPESWFRLKLIDLGFPMPEVNWPFTDLNGRELYFLDIAWPAFRIAIEYDGYEAHVGRAGLDAAREADIRRRGWIVIRAAALDLSNARRVERELKTAFAARGHRW
jgi:hypothetical protein